MKIERVSRQFFARRDGCRSISDVRAVQVTLPRVRFLEGSKDAEKYVANADVPDAPRKPHRRAPREDMYVKLAAEGASVADIARRFKVSRAQVHAVITRRKSEESENANGSTEKTT